MEVDGGSALHPLMCTAGGPRWGEDSVDMSVDSERRVGEDEETQRVFGMPTVGTQGPAGSRVPDLDDRSRHAAPFEVEDDDVAGMSGYPEDPDAPPDAVGPVPAVEAEMTAEELSSSPGAAAAADAVLAARRAGRYGSAAMMDALEEAEEAFERQEAAEHEAARQQRLSHLGSHGGDAAHAAAAARAELAASPGASAARSAGEGAGWAGADRPPDTPRKRAICEGTRERMVQAVFEALQTNPKYGSEPTHAVLHHAKAVEDACFVSSHSQQVYLSKVSNAVRLARTATDVADIPRIASGEPRAVAEGHTAGPSTPYVSGLTGYVIKPQM